MARKCSDCKNSHPAVSFYGKSKRCTTCQKTYMTNYRAQNRLDALIAYGGPTPTCSCPGCDESRLPFLTIDHINHGGRKHRQEVHGPTGGAIFLWLKKHKYPDGYRVMCYNCNVARRDGQCPVHSISSEESPPSPPLTAEPADTSTPSHK